MIWKTKYNHITQKTIWEATIQAENVAKITYRNGERYECSITNSPRNASFEVLHDAKEWVENKLAYFDNSRKNNYPTERKPPTLKPKFITKES